MPFKPVFGLCSFTAFAQTRGDQRVNTVVVLEDVVQLQFSWWQGQRLANFVHGTKGMRLVQSQQLSDADQPCGWMRMPDKSSDAELAKHTRQSTASEQHQCKKTKSGTIAHGRHQAYMF